MSTAVQFEDERHAGFMRGLEKQQCQCAVLRYTIALFDSNSSWVGMLLTAQEIRGEGQEQSQTKIVRCSRGHRSLLPSPNALDN